MRPLRHYVLPALLALLTACRPAYQLTTQTAQRLPVDASTPADSATTAWLLPYRQGLDKTMNEVLARTTTRLEKQRPECALNDLLADALLAQATRKLGKPIDLAQLNFGGIRNGLPDGNVTVGNVFEVMPFDNQLVVLTVTGTMLQQFLNHFAHDEALVISGARVVIRNGDVHRATLTNGRVIAPEQTYTIALSDYVANGGSNAFFLKDALRRDTLNYLIRDALIDYFREQGRTGKPLNCQADGRILLE